MLPSVQPIAPIRRTEPFDDPERVFDLKYDGFRGICYLEQGCCRMRRPRPVRGPAADTGQAIPRAGPAGVLADPACAADN